MASADIYNNRPLPTMNQAYAQSPQFTSGINAIQSMAQSIRNQALPTNMYDRAMSGMGANAMQSLNMARGTARRAQAQPGAVGGIGASIEQSVMDQELARMALERQNALQSYLSSQDQLTSSAMNPAASLFGQSVGMLGQREAGANQNMMGMYQTEVQKKMSDDASRRNMLGQIFGGIAGGVGSLGGGLMGLAR